MTREFKGVIVPLVTPFCGDRVDYPALKRVMDRCIDGGADGFVALGTTAETPTLTSYERCKILDFCLSNANGRFVIAGAGENCTREAVKQTKKAESMGADGILSICPYYNKPPKTGIIEHFKEISDATSLPIILYDVPKRTGCRIHTDAMLELKKTTNIIGVKAAYSTEEEMTEVAAVCDESFKLYCGDDLLTLFALKNDCSGLISAAANVLTKEFCSIFYNYTSGKTGLSQKQFKDIYPVLQALYIETNPMAIKYALYRLGLINNTLRLPMCPLSRKNEEKLNIYIN